MGFLNMETAATEFGTSAHSLRMAAKSGKLPGARKIGGRFSVESALNRGTEVSVVLPYDSPDPSRRLSDTDVIRWIGL